MVIVLWMMMHQEFIHYFWKKLLTSCQEGYLSVLCNHFFMIMKIWGPRTHDSQIDSIFQPLDNDKMKHLTSWTRPLEVRAKFWWECFSSKGIAWIWIQFDSIGCKFKSISLNLISLGWEEGSSEVQKWSCLEKSKDHPFNFHNEGSSLETIIFRQLIIDHQLIKRWIYQFWDSSFGITLGKRDAVCSSLKFLEKIWTPSY